MTPAAPTHSAAFSGGKALLWLLSHIWPNGRMAQHGVPLMLLMRLINGLNLHLPRAFLRDPRSRVSGTVCSA